MGDEWAQAPAQRYGAVRLHQVIDTTGGKAKLNIYEGMTRVFQIFIVDSPESPQTRAGSSNLSTLLGRNLKQSRNSPCGQTAET